MNPSILVWMGSKTPWLIAWFAFFTVINFGRITWRFWKGNPPVSDNAGYTELAGLPLTFMQPVCFVKAVLVSDVWSALLFLWWGPGFLCSLGGVGIARLRKHRIDWTSLALPISWACKITYVVYLFLFYWFNLPGIAFAFSAWIINDQVEKLFMSLDADRTRRTFHDRWVVRLCYPLGLLIPCFVPSMPYRAWFAGYGCLLLSAWLGGLYYVYQAGKFYKLPSDPSLLRNMVYFGKLRVDES